MTEKLNKTNNSYKPTYTDKSLLSLVFNEDKNNINETLGPNLNACLFLLLILLLFLLVFCVLTCYNLFSRLIIFIVLATILYFLFAKFMDEEKR